MTDYNVVTYDLAVATQAPVPISGSVGKKVASVSVLDIPTGASAFLRIGSRTAPQLQLAVNRNFQMFPSEVDGVFFDNPVAGAGLVQLAVSFGDCSLNVSSL